MTEPLTITIPGRPPGGNTGSRKTNWYIVHEDTAWWRGYACLIADEAMPAGWVPLQRARLAIEFVIPTRADRDPDNLVSTTKPLTDGLVDAGVIAADSLRVIGFPTYSHRYERGVSATVYRIEPLEPDQQDAGL